jgi:uncharacterized protein
VIPDHRNCGRAVIAAFYGPSLAHKLSDERLERVILVLLLVIGLALIVESFLPQEAGGLLPAALIWHICAGVFFGLGIGLVSSLLGVAGGEMIIPTLVFAFGANIKTAGTASLLISFPTICVGLLRYAKSGAFSDRRPLRLTATKPQFAIIRANLKRPADGIRFALLGWIVQQSVC